MAIDQAVIAASPGETRVALLEAGQVIEFIIDRGDPAAGDVLEGRVVEVVPGLGAAFVDIGGSAPGFLGKPKGASVGGRVIVEVAVAPRPARAPSCAWPRAGGRSATGAHRAGPRRASRHRPRPGRRSRHLGRGARSCPTPCTTPNAGPATSGCGRCLRRSAGVPRPLPGGAALEFAETAAAIVIDVDGGGLAPIAANLAALPVVARHLRLRGIGGHVLVAAIPTSDPREGAKLVEILRAGVAGDPAPVQIAGRTPLGMIELTRRRTGPSLADVMLERAAVVPNALTMALDGVRALLREADARPMTAPTLILSPAAAAALRGRAGVLAEVERRLGRAPALLERHGIEQFQVEDGWR